MNAHKLTSVQLVQFYFQRIKKLNPKLHAIITLSPTAMKDAQAADKARRTGDRRPLLGIPIIVKDNVDTTGMPTTAGSWALDGSTPTDAFLVQRLKAAGALIIAKANLSEWANFRSGPSSSGWSGEGGQVSMPYVLDRNPCGSSSGSGVVAAADLAVAAVGTETDGSIVCPAGANGVVGIKPTLGLWSRDGVVPISAEQDTAGPIARNVTDAAVLLGAATGVDPNDAATAAQTGHAFTDYTQFLDAHALEGARIGVWRAGTYDPTLTGPVVEPILTDVIDTLEAQGATVVDPTDIDLSAAFANEFPALLCEFKSDIASYLTAHTAAGFPKTLADLIAFDQAHPELEGPWNDAVFEAAEATNGRDADCADLPRGDDPANPGRHRPGHGRQQPRRDRRSHERAGVAEQRERRRGRPQRPLRVLRRHVDGRGGRRLRRDHGSGGVCRRAPGRDHVHRRPLVRAGADRLRLRLRAGHEGPRAADVHPDDRRRPLPRRAEPGGDPGPGEAPAGRPAAPSRPGRANAIGHGAGRSP